MPITWRLSGAEADHAHGHIYDYRSTIDAKDLRRKDCGEDSVQMPAGFRDSKLFRWGLVGLVFGTGPLLLAVAIAHLRGDPNPNPIGPGILAGVTFWPSLICVVVGWFKK